MSGTVGAHNELHSEEGALPASTRVGRAIRSSRSPTSRGSSSRSPTWTAPRRSPAHSASPPCCARPTNSAARHRRRHRRACCCGAAPGRASSERRSRRSTRSTSFGWPKPQERDATPLPESLGGISVDLIDPSGLPVRVVAGTHELTELTPQQPLVVNVGHQLNRTNATQRPPRIPAASSGSATSSCRPPNT